MEKGEKACVRVRGNPLPFAVGETLMCWEAVLVNRYKGKCFATLHSYGDMLTTTSVVPNIGFRPACIAAIQEEGSDDVDDVDAGDADGADDDVSPEMTLMAECVEVECESCGHISGQMSLHTIYVPTC